MRECVDVLVRKQKRGRVEVLRSGILNSRSVINVTFSDIRGSLNFLIMFLISITNKMYVTGFL